MKVPRLLALAGLACLPAATLANTGPEAYRGLAVAAYTHLNPSQLVSEDSAYLIIPAAAGPLKFTVSSHRRHANGDLSYSADAPDQQGSVHLTLGANGAFGDIRLANQHWLVTSDGSGTWLVALPPSGISYNQCGTNHSELTAPALNRSKSGSSLTPAAIPPANVVDVLIIYTQALADRYPGELLETRLNHLMDIANQTTGNSAIDLGFRLVGSQLTGYSDTNSNEELLRDISDTLDGNEKPGLEGLKSLRDNLGADLVIGLRPHEIEIRGNCGLAFFPNNDASLGTNVVSDGMSSWSACLDDVLTHEIGHNLGASHQAGFGGGAFDQRGAAFAVPNQFTTVMASFGTGRPDRFRGLPVFSSPLIDCGGFTCGDAADTDNAVIIREQMAGVAGYQPAVSGIELPEALPRSDDDTDGDGVIDWDDLFPFDASEQTDADLDGTGDVADAFPFNASEQQDTDEDGVGNIADLDDDGDEVNDITDAFPLDVTETRDDDRDGVGNNVDAFPQNDAEFSDFDQDGIGNHADADDDGDGIDEFDPVAEDILVISTGNNRILRFDAQTGEPRGIEVPPSDGLVTFQSDLAWRVTDNTLHYFSDSSIKRVDLLDRRRLGTWVPPFSTIESPGTSLGSGFPTALEPFFGGTHIATTRMGNAALRHYTGEEVAGEDITINWSVSPGESPIDIVEFEDGALVLGQTSQTIYKVNNLGFQFLSGPAASWMRDPRYMLLSGDDRLFVSDTGRDTVVAIDTETGDFLGDFINLKADGFRDPTGLALTHDNELLVASARRNAIVAYDAQSGAFLGERVPRNSWGLREPHAMILVAALIDRLNNDADRVIRPNAGLWFNPATNGRGFDIQVFGTRLSAIWYTYEEDGLPIWYFSAGELNGFEYNGPLLRFSLDSEGQSSFEAVGVLDLVFASERRAEMSYNIGTVFGGESLQWQAFDADEAISDYTGLWNRDDGPGWGISMSTQGNTTVAIAFIYDGAGNPRWVISEAVNGRSPHTFNMIAFFSDSLCPGCSDESLFETLAAGTMDLDLEQSPTWSSDIDFPAPLEGEWLLDEVPIIRISDSPAAPR